MKICAIICEFNPFHNGHSYLLSQAKLLSGSEKTLCLMSGNFTQRGEAAVFDKFTRAKHAVLGGADAVIQLPTAFSVAPAEIFARGAAKIICSIPEIKSVAFGSECGDIAAIEKTAEILNEESDKFKSALKEKLNSGESYPKSVNYACEACGGAKDVLSKPNNVLAVLYIKELKDLGFKGNFVAVKRLGAEHSDINYSGTISSSTAIRKNLFNDNSDYVPDFVADDLKNANDLSQKLEQAERLCVLRDKGDDLSQVYGMNEGLNYAVKKLVNLPYDEMISKLTNKRYTSSRVTRALCANLLKLYKYKSESYLKEALYIKPLAVRGGEMLSALSKSSYPVIVRGRELEKLSPSALLCLNDDIFADDMYSLLSGKKQEFFTIIKL